MKAYKGVVEVHAEPMNYQTYKAKKNEPVVSLEDQDGYFVRKEDKLGNNEVVIREFWLPKAQFEVFYRETPIEKDNHLEHQINYANKRVKDAQDHGLLGEVIVSALQTMQMHPYLFISAAIDEGCREWDV